MGNAAEDTDSSPPPDKSLDCGDGDDKEDVCVICGGTPCEWDEHKKELEEHEENLFFCDEDGNGNKVKMDADGNPVSDSKMRFALHQAFACLKFGHLGEGNRIPIPNCVLGKNVLM